MPIIDDLTKTRLKGAKHSIADLARALDVTYHHLSSVLNGYAWPNEEFQARIEAQLRVWEGSKEVSPNKVKDNG